MMKGVQEMRMRAEEDMETQKREYESRLKELGAQMVSSKMCCVTVSEREGRAGGPEHGVEFSPAVTRRD